MQLYAVWISWCFLYKDVQRHELGDLCNLG
jgi:hypothetical protein